jgi:hypothetical protein
MGTGVFTFSIEANGLLTKNQTKWPILTEEILNNHKNELEWLSGFAEAESVFYISKTGTFTFRIKLHYDDRNTLVYIQNLLSKLAKRSKILDLSLYLIFLIIDNIAHFLLQTTYKKRDIINNISTIIKKLVSLFRIRSMKIKFLLYG